VDKVIAGNGRSVRVMKHGEWADVLCPCTVAYFCLFTSAQPLEEGQQQAAFHSTANGRSFRKHQRVTPKLVLPELKIGMDKGAEP
jgi:hypothetical protein